MKYPLYDKHYLEVVYNEIFKDSTNTFDGNITVEEIKNLGYLRSGSYADRIFNLIFNQGDFVKLERDLKLKNGLLAHWGFVGTENIDQSGRGNVLTNGGTVLNISPIEGYYTNITGTELMSTSVSFSDFTLRDYSISFWFRMGDVSNNSTKKNICNRFSADGFRVDYSSDGNIYFKVGTTTAEIQHSAGLTDWNHIVVAVSPKNKKMKLYFNKELIEEKIDITITQVPLTGTSVVFGGTADCEFDIDEIMVFQNYISSYNVEILYNNASGEYKDIRYYLKEKRNIIL